MGTLDIYFFINKMSENFKKPTLEDLIGKNETIKEKKQKITIDGDIFVTTWTYTDSSCECLKPPVIALHGGPAFTHNYMLPLKLLALSGYPVIFYDQAGCGESFQVEDVEKETPQLLTIEYYVNEMQTIVDELVGK